MHAHVRTCCLVSAAGAAVLLGGCASGQRLGERLGWVASHPTATAQVQASCEAATRTLKGRPDHASALSACLDAKTRQQLRD